MAHGDQVADPAQRAKQANSFGGAADAYDLSRPGYPAEAVRDALGTTPRRVLDLGAGTGKLTRVLASQGHAVVAVDPDAAMLALLGRRLPDVTRLVGTAEAIPVDDASVDAVVAGQAFHWFDIAGAGPELVRVLAPGGLVALLWNIRASDAAPWIAEYDVLVDMVRTAARDDEPPDLGPLFTAPKVRWYEHHQRLDLDGLVALAESRSYVITAPEPQRAEILREVRALGERELARTGEGTLRMPYRLQVWTATPR